FLTRFGGLRAGRLSYARRRDSTYGSQRDCGERPGNGVRFGRTDRCGVRDIREFTDDPLHGLQRYLLEAGPITSLRHISGGDCGLRAVGERWQGVARRARTRAWT